MKETGILFAFLICTTFAIGAVFCQMVLKKIDDIYREYSYTKELIGQNRENIFKNKKDISSINNGLLIPNRIPVHIEYYGDKEITGSMNVLERINYLEKYLKIKYKEDKKKGYKKVKE